MKYRFLGHSGLRVSRVCLGTMTFGNKEWGCDQETATAITHRFIDHGGNFIDTADLYSAGVSEEMLGIAIKDQSRDDLVIATKCWFPTGSGPNARGLTRKHIFEACDASLRRLGLDFVDLYQIHGPDPYTPIEETMRALDDLVRSGRVRYIGCSNLYAWQIAKAQLTAEKLSLERFISAQHLFNLINRDVEREVLPACEDLGLGMICWSPLASGLLTGKYRGQSSPDKDSRLGRQGARILSRYWFDDSIRLVEKLSEEAKRLDHTPVQLALSWILADPRISATIVGIRETQQLEDAIVVGDWEIPEASRKALSDALPLQLGYPNSWMSGSFPGTFGVPTEDPKHLQRLPEQG